MFWRFNYLSSEIDTLLDKEDVTLLEIISEDDVLQECKAQNKKLVDFLTLPEHMTDLVNMVILEPSSETEEKLKYKFPNIACELITSDVNAITEALSSAEPLLNSLVAYLDKESPLNPLQTSFFSKVMGLLITRKSQLILDFLKSRENFIARLLHHMDTSAIMDLLLRLVMSMESPECKAACLSWLNEQQIVQKLVSLLHHSHSSEMHSNAAQSLCDLIRHGRDQMILEQENCVTDVLLATIQSKENISQLLNNMFEDASVESVLINGLSVIQMLLEFRKIGSDGQMEALTTVENEKFLEGIDGVLKAVIPRLPDFHKLLTHPPLQHYMPMPTTFGLLTVPLGNARLQTVRLFASLLGTNSPAVYEELARLDTLNVLLDLYFQYIWNNFLHTQVEHCIIAIVNCNDCSLLSRLIGEFQLLDKIVEAFNRNQEDQCKPGGHRKGFMGHLTRISNSLISNKNAQKINELVQGLPDDASQKWTQFVSNSLAELNKQNSTELAGGSVSGIPSNTDDDFHIEFPSEGSEQKFGFIEDEFGEQEDAGFSLKEQNWLSLSPTSCENSQASTSMFEDMCTSRGAGQGQTPMQQSEPGDEEVWDDKESSSVNPFPALPETSKVKTLNPDEDKEVEEDKNSSDEEEEGSFRQSAQNPVDDMDVTANDNWAKFDEVPMDVAPAVDSSPWDTGSSSGNFTIGWANFSAFPEQKDDTSLDNHSDRVMENCHSAEIGSPCDVIDDQLKTDSVHISPERDLPGSTNGAASKTDSQTQSCPAVLANKNSPA
jgi:serine/threonine-protein phosphatase 6 regulatory subunit 3